MLKWLKAMAARETATRDLIPTQKDQAIERLLQVLKDDWWPERSLVSKDYGERRLLAALVLAYPEEIHTREKCAKSGCGPDAWGCDECLGESDVPGLLKRAAEVLAGIEHNAFPEVATP